MVKQARDTCDKADTSRAAILSCNQNSLQYPAHPSFFGFSVSAANNTYPLSRPYSELNGDNGGYSEDSLQSRDEFKSVRRRLLDASSAQQVVVRVSRNDDCNFHRGFGPGRPTVRLTKQDYCRHCITINCWGARWRGELFLGWSRLPDCINRVYAPPRQNEVYRGSTRV
jgi:hypothetical protein